MQITPTPTNLTKSSRLFSLCPPPTRSLFVLSVFLPFGFYPKKLPYNLRRKGYSAAHNTIEPYRNLVADLGVDVLNSLTVPPSTPPLSNELRNRILTVMACAPMSIVLLSSTIGQYILLYTLHYICIYEALHLIPLPPTPGRLPHSPQGWESKSKAKRRDSPQTWGNKFFQHLKTFFTSSAILCIFTDLLRDQTIPRTISQAVPLLSTSLNYLSPTPLTILLVVTTVILHLCPPSKTFAAITATTLTVTTGFTHLVLISTASLPKSIFFCLCVWNFDNASLAIGKLYEALTKKGPEAEGNTFVLFKPLRKILDKVSPKKTVVGVIGGMVGSVVTSCVVSSGSMASLIGLNNDEDLRQYFLSRGSNPIITGIILGFLSLLGDLLISRAKRAVGKKDTGNLFPGHGGALDRMDSMMITGVWFYHFHVRGS